MSRLHVRLLGSFHASLDGERLADFRTKKVQALFIYLLLHALEEPAVRVDRDGVMVLFWPEKPGDAGRANLRQTLYYLRKAIPELSDAGDAPVPFILSDRQQIWINPEAGYDLDVADFTALVENENRDALSAAVDLYRDDLLCDFHLKGCPEFDRWLTEWRAQLRRQVLEALDHLAALHLNCREAAEAAIFARRAVEIDGLRESAHRHLITALARMGRRAEALRQFEVCRAHLEETLSVPPSPDTEAVVQAVREGNLGDGSVEDDSVGNEDGAPPPAPDNPIIGRESDVAAILDLLEGAARLVSIVGPGGIGKTRLALEVAHRLAAHSDQRVAFVDLTPLSRADEIARAVVRGLGVEAIPGDNEDERQRLLDYLYNKELVLVLDNFEHLLEGTTLLKGILRKAPGVSLLVTSRERLKLRAEHIHLLSGLAYADWTTPKEAARSSAAQLFLHHARRVRPDFDLGSDHLPALRQIVELTEGMPLPLILAAGWVEVLSPAEIAAELHRSLDFLASTHRDVPPRQRNMRTVFDATWARLDTQEQALFSALSVFRGGFTRAAARTVAGASPAALLRLTDCSLLERDEAERFSMHELLRQFAEDRLADRGEDAQIRDAHSTYYIDLLACHLPELTGPNQRTALNAIDTDFDNVRAAWHRACAHACWQQMANASQSLYLFAWMRSRYGDAIELFDLALGAIGTDAPPGPERAYMLAGRDLLRSLATTGARSPGSLADLRAIVETSDNVRAGAYCQITLGLLLQISKHNREATSVLADAQSYFEGAGEPFFAALAAQWRALSLTMDGRPEAAIECSQRGLALARQAGDQFISARCLIRLGTELKMLEGPSERVESYTRHGVTMVRALGEKAYYAKKLAEVATMPLWREGDAAAALPLLQEALTILEEQNVPAYQVHALAELTLHRLVEGRYEEAMALSGEVLAEPTTFPETWMVAAMQHGIVLLALGHCREALPFLRHGLSEMVVLNYPGYLTGYLPFFGIVFAELGEEQRAVELLACGFAQPSVCGRLQIDPLITRFRAEMEEILGEERFAAAWERGAALDAMVTANEVLAELA